MEIAVSKVAVGGGRVYRAIHLFALFMPNRALNRTIDKALPPLPLWSVFVNRRLTLLLRAY